MNWRNQRSRTLGVLTDIDPWESRPAPFDTYLEEIALVVAVCVNQRNSVRTSTDALVRWRSGLSPNPWLC